MRRRRAIGIFIVGVTAISLLAGAMPRLVQDTLHTSGDIILPSGASEADPGSDVGKGLAMHGLEILIVKGHAPKTGYSRNQFGDGWVTLNGCTTREIILYRDLVDVQLEDACTIHSGTLHDPYTGKDVVFTRDAASAIQIDHVVALSNAWQTGAQSLTKEMRIQLANDPLELLAVDGSANQQKSDGDSATWLPKNKAFRCEYIARQIAVKIKYKLWVTKSEADAMRSVLKTCPSQALPVARL